jgi:hypothetical protein
MGGGLDRRAQPRSAGADDQDVVLVRFVLGHQKSLRSWMVPMATRRT